MGRVGAEQMEQGGQTHDRFQQDEEIAKGWKIHLLLEKDEE